jgi:cyclase
MREKLLLAAVAGLAWIGSSYPVVAQQGLEAVEIVTTQVAEGVYMLTGAGGNIGVLAGPEGIVLVDDQYAPLTDKIRRALAAISPTPVRFVLNTHWHGDHTGGNEALGQAGAVIVAHDNVRRRMSVEQFLEAFGRRVPASPPGALPVVTFTEAVTFHLNGEELHAFHVPPAHTDGDTIVHFRTADVLHMGDVFFNGSYPFIDLSSGGSVAGVIDAVGRALELATPETRVIPGHGALATPAELEEYRRMLKSVRHRVAALRAEGLTLEEIIADRPTAAWDEAWGGGFITGAALAETVFQSLQREGGAPAAPPPPAPEPAAEPSGEPLAP